VSRSRVFRTSSFRHALMYAGLTGISFLVLFGVIFWSTARFMRHQIDDSVSSELDEITTDSQASNAEGIATIVQGLAKHSSGFYYLLQDPTGVVQAGNLPAVGPRLGIREWGESPRSPYSAIRGRGINISGDYLFVGWSTHQLHEMEEMVVSSFVWGLATSIALALAGGIATSGRLLRKIEVISETSRNIIEGDLPRRVPVTQTGDEFDHLADSINTMLDRIQALMEDLRQVTTDIAHDMRTPLTRLRQRLEVAQQSPADVAQQREILATTIVEIDAILGIFGALLRIAQIESGARKAAFTSVHLSDLLHTAVELYRSAADDKNQLLEEKIDAGLTVKGDRELLMQLFANLIENAIRHAPPGAHISVMARRDGDKADISVTDNGPGIPDSMHAKVMQRFFRLESSRTTPGSGLGLSLALAIVNLHNATLKLGDNSPGLSVAVSLAMIG
jgi:signal transduction histidine kinase